MPSVSFTVPGKSISVNSRYLNGFVTSPEYRNWVKRVKQYAFVAKSKDVPMYWCKVDEKGTTVSCESVWPALDSIERRTVTVEVIAYGSRHDADGPLKAAMDAMEGVFYNKDSAVRKVVGEVASLDKGQEPYLRITVTVSV